MATVNKTINNVKYADTTFSGSRNVIYPSNQSNLVYTFYVEYGVNSVTENFSPAPNYANKATDIIIQHSLNYTFQLSYGNVTFYPSDTSKFTVIFNSTNNTFTISRNMSYLPAFTGTLYATLTIDGIQYTTVTVNVEASAIVTYTATKATNLNSGIMLQSTQYSTDNGATWTSFANTLIVYNGTNYIFRGTFINSSSTGRACSISSPGGNGNSFVPPFSSVTVQTQPYNPTTNFTVTYTC